MLALAGAIGFAGNEIASPIRLRAGRRLDSPALIADGNHARATPGQPAVVASAAVVALGLDVGDPLIGLAITLVILRITWQSCDRDRARPRALIFACVVASLAMPLRLVAFTTSS